MYEIPYIIGWYILLTVVLYRSKRIKYHLGLFLLTFLILFTLENILVYFGVFQYFSEPKVILVPILAILLYFPFVSISVEFGNFIRRIAKTKRTYIFYFLSTMLVAIIFDYTAYIFGYWKHVWNFLADYSPIAIEAEISVGIVIVTIVYIYEKVLKTL
jgi:hypothetical protein